MSDRNAKNYTNGSRFYYWAKSLITVNIGSLTTPISNKAVFVSKHSTIYIDFLLKQPNTISMLAAEGRGTST